MVDLVNAGYEIRDLAETRELCVIVRGGVFVVIILDLIALLLSYVDTIPH